MYRGAKLVCRGIFLHCQFLDNLTTVEVDVIIMANSFTYFKFVSEHHDYFSINFVEEEEKNIQSRVVKRESKSKMLNVRVKVCLD